jgi:hypothetical protein
MNCTSIIPYIKFNSLQFIKKEYQKCENRIYEQILLQEKIFSTVHVKTTILCVEVGQTRFKAAILSFPIKPKQLMNIVTLSGPTHQGLQKLEEFFNYLRPNPLSNLFLQQPNAISLSISAPVYDRSRRWLHGDRRESTQKNIEHATRRTVLIENDSVSWATGALEFLKLQGKSIAFPCLAITLGTGIGVALIESINQIKDIEIWITHFPYPRLRKYVHFAECARPQCLLEKAFLDSISNGEENTDNKMKTYRATYNLHFRAFMEDVCERLESLFGLTTISTVLVGGGYSRFILKPSMHTRSVIVLNPTNLISSGFSPDIIQLIGCLKNSLRSYSFSTVYPTEVQMKHFLKGDVPIDFYNHQEVIKKSLKLDTDILFERLTGYLNGERIGIYKYEGQKKIPLYLCKRKNKNFVEDPFFKTECLIKVGKSFYSYRIAIIVP